ncbi:unnamed protein product [Dovyalis caffra]|uniref:Uncharacterized protein n=1 Tax=Dovyalis caffra TaxID=77055 RepID=A0AAV1R3Z3_9ROSI|nr:unnamed protein product [Dovyalis caffra]
MESPKLRRQSRLKLCEGPDDHFIDMEKTTLTRCGVTSRRFCLHAHERARARFWVDFIDKKLNHFVPLIVDPIRRLVWTTSSENKEAAANDLIE